MYTQNQLEIKKYITPAVKLRMNKWEQKFITSLYQQSNCWSEKQVEVFEKIKKKYQLEEVVVQEKVIYLPTGYAEGAKLNQEITSKGMRRSRGINTKRNGYNNKKLK